jgi:hypothetical protein
MRPAWGECDCGRVAKATDEHAHSANVAASAATSRAKRVLHRGLMGRLLYESREIGETGTAPGPHQEKHKRGMCPARGLDSGFRDAATAARQAVDI